MNVLSLFDGISCGQIALNKLGFKIDNYFASEVDQYAIKITKKNFPNTIHIGDVTKIKGSELPQIDLLIGGSPCQGFSFAGKQLNFNDPRSALFFEFVRLLKETKPKYFMLENVRMKQEYLDVINEYLEIKPIIINSNLVSAQNRIRFYWTNIQNITQPQDKNIMLKDILDDDAIEPMLSNIYGGFKEIKPRIHYGKSVTIRTSAGGGHIPSITLKNGNYRTINPTECEKLQTIPIGYTEGVSNTQRYKMLGNGWTVDVIAHILKGIKHDNDKMEKDK
jgi:DNA (cytosine-5)-methyltransferase 3A